MRDQIIYMPRHIRFFALTILGLSCLVSFGLVGYLLYWRPNGAENIVAASIGLAQASATAFGVLFVLLYSRFSMRAQDTARRTDEFLAEDMPRALKLVDFVRPPFHERPRETLDAATRTKVQISYVLGSHAARYRISAHGLEQELFVMLNVRKLVVVYEFAADWIERLDAVKATFDFVTEGARHTGYTVEWRQMQNHESGTAHLELRALLSLGDNFIVDPLERRFISTDIAIMTRAAMQCARQVGEGLAPPRQQDPASGS